MYGVGCGKAEMIDMDHDCLEEIFEMFGDKLEHQFFSFIYT